MTSEPQTAPPLVLSTAHTNKALTSPLKQHGALSLPEKVILDSLTPSPYLLLNLQFTLTTLSNTFQQGYLWDTKANDQGEQAIKQTAPLTCSCYGAERSSTFCRPSTELRLTDLCGFFGMTLSKQGSSMGTWSYMTYILMLLYYQLHSL